MTASVIVLSYRPGDWLAPCLASVVDQADQLIVVDNGSEGAAASHIAGTVGAEIVRLSRNRGFTGGFNAGLARARGDLVAVLNDDAVADPGWLEAAAKTLADPEVAAVTPKVLLSGWWGELVFDDQSWTGPGDGRPLGRRLLTVSVDGVDVLDRILGGGVHRLEGIGFGDRERPQPWRWTAGSVPFYVPLSEDGTGQIAVNGAPVEAQAVCHLINHAGSALHVDGTASELGLGAPDDGRLDQPGDRFGFSGTAPVFRAETLARLGSLANPFFAYCEDTDWCFRAHLAGMRIAYQPEGIVRHRLSATSGGPRVPLVRLLTERNAMLGLVRNAPWPVASKTVRDKLDIAGPPLRRSLLRHLPWAIASRQLLRRLWKVSPEEVWARWADVTIPWDTAPIDLAWVRANRPANDVHRPLDTQPPAPGR
jgi:GT2 family glycosyltransferase